MPLIGSVGLLDEFLPFGHVIAQGRCLIYTRDLNVRTTSMGLSLTADKCVILAPRKKRRKHWGSGFKVFEMA
jgi:hypothetical protein